MNVLLTCAGRRNYLVGFFRAALAGSGELCAADANPHAVALQEADRAFLVPSIEAPDYVERIVELCREHKIGLVVSLNDLELPILADAREHFAEVGTRLVVSSPEVIRTCFDKWETFRFLRAHGLPTPRTYLSASAALDDLSSGAITWPLVIKPRWGSASIGIEYVRDERELEIGETLLLLRLSRTILANASVSDPEHPILFQQCLRGQEIGVDVVNDFDGQTAAVLARRKLTMRSGETDRAETFEDARVTQLGHRLGAALRHIGNLDCDMFLEPEGPIVMELNPRFGGGYPFSHAAGADIPAALLAWARNETPDPAWLRIQSGVLASKCDRLVIHRPMV